MENVILNEFKLENHDHDLSILKRQLLTIKADSNPLRFYHQFCQQNLTNLLIYIDKCNSNGVDDLKNVSIEILKSALLTKNHLIIYNEFFKNLPFSYSDKSNHQATILFHTLRNETKSGNILIRNFYLVAQELFKLSFNVDYKIKVCMCEFLINFVHSMNGDEDAKVESITRLLQLIDELSIYTQIDDKNNQNLFHHWLVTYVEEIFEFKHSEKFVCLLNQLLQLNHLLLDSCIYKIFKVLNDKDLIIFQAKYLDLHVAVRQFSKVTHKLVSFMSTNDDISLSNDFYKLYEDHLVNFHVDIQTIVTLWSDCLKLLNENITLKVHFSIEITKFLNCFMNRINIHSSSTPDSFKNQIYSLLNETKNSIKQFILTQDMKNPVYVHLLKTLTSCGFVYVLMYRFSSADRKSFYMNDMIKFLDDINNELKLKTLIKSAHSNQLWTHLYYLNRLKLVYFYALRVLPLDVELNVQSVKTQLKSILSIKLPNDYTYDFNKSYNVIDERQLGILNWKSIVLDHFHILHPLLDDEDRRVCFIHLLKLLLFKKENDHFWIVDSINLNALFDNVEYLPVIIEAFLVILGEFSSEDKSVVFSQKRKRDSSSDLFEFLLKYLHNDYINDVKLVNYLNKKRNVDYKIFLKIVYHLPIRYFNKKYSFIMFLLNEIYLHEFQLFSSTLEKVVDMLPIEYLKNSFMKLFDYDENVTKIFQSFIQFLMKEANYTHLFEITDNLLAKTSKFQLDNLNDTDLKYLKVTNYILVQVMQRISTIIGNPSVKNEQYKAKLEENLQKFLNHFIEFDLKSDQLPNQALKNDIVSNKFAISVILVRHFLSRDSNDDEKSLEYVKISIGLSLKNHKKAIKHGALLPDSQIDFINAYILTSNRLGAFLGHEIDKIKFLRKFFMYIINACNSMDDEYQHKLNKSFATCINSLNKEDFKSILIIIDDISFQVPINHLSLIKTMKLLNIFCNDNQIDKNLEEDFTSYLQKFIAKIQPVYYNLEKNDFNGLLTILHHQQSLLGSKNFILPSHLIITCLQAYYSINFENLNGKDFFELQSLICKDLSNIIKRYSKKFSKIIGIISNLLIKMIGVTTSHTNQNSITNETLPKIINGIQNLDRLVSQLDDFKKQFNKITPYLISEYCTRASTIAIHPEIKPILTNTIYNLINLCDVHSCAQLHVVLPTGPKDLFKILYAEYNKYFKFTGKI